MKVTAKMLRDKGTCEPDVEAFEKEWSDGANPTLKNCRRASELRLNLDWFASKLLTEVQYEAFAKARGKAIDIYIADTLNDEKAWKVYLETQARALYEAMKL